MNKIFLLIITICFCSFSYAQDIETKTFRPNNPYDKYWQFNFTTGANIDLIHSGSDPNSKLLSTRPTVAPMLGFRVTHLFSKKIGWNASLQMNFYKEKKSEYFGSGIIGDVIEEFFNKTFWPVSILHPSFDVGIVYRIEQNRWNIYPTIGFGYMNYLLDTESTKSNTNVDGIQNSIIYKQYPSSLLFLNFGISANYYITERSFFVLNANFQQPLQKSHAELINITNKMETNKMSYQTTTAGRNLNIGIGFGFRFGEKAKR